ncbi:hypothetical protein [Winogradskyella sp. MIT101101]|uniref:hypothetical protein n=1 Tax=Winogradskyella sp. MIT101101 TaxID=3098297 RepID=UPI00399AA51F
MKRFSILMVLLLVACKTISVSNENQTKTIHHKELGMIGEEKLFLLEEDYNSIALPIYDQPVKLKMNVIEFGKSSYKAFSKANNSKAVPIIIAYDDSLEHKPKFLKLEIADRVTVLNTINEVHNKDVKDYILNKKNAHIISAVSIALGDEKMRSVLEADALFLEQEVNKTFVLKAYKNNQIHITLKFSDGVVFAYQASNFCWLEDDRHQLEVVDIVESTDKCPKGTYRSAKRAKKKVDYFKF